MATKKQQQSADSKPNFESTLAKLEVIITTLEHNDTTLEESLSAFENGINLARNGQRELSRAEQKVNLLLEENNAPLVQSFSEEDQE